MEFEINTIVSEFSETHIILTNIIIANVTKELRNFIIVYQLHTYKIIRYFVVLRNCASSKDGSNTQPLKITNDQNLNMLLLGTFIQYLSHKLTHNRLVLSLLII